MIHHVSIPALNPANVAKVLAELLGGSVSQFGPYQNSYIAWARDRHGTAIEVFPTGTELFPAEGPGQAQFKHNANHTGLTTTHIAVSVDIDADSIIALAQRESWRAVELSRGSFRVIEFWVENRVMLEILPPEMAREYLAATRF